MIGKRKQAWWRARSERKACRVDLTRGGHVREQAQILWRTPNR